MKNEKILNILVKTINLINFLIYLINFLSTHLLRIFFVFAFAD